MKNIIVVAALLKKDNKILIARRSTGNDSVLGKWEFPGGKVESNETEEQAIKREINEEFMITIKAQKYITNTVHIYPTKTVDLRLYECTYVSGNITLHDHYEYKWIDIKDLLTYDLAPADISLATYLKESNYE